ncbi:MAG: M56 family metallopeptidase [Verrucomicrobiales bacterium]|jgi:beta-lactamase regulating signal transducer with metallopeptidase domain|nr:M56 family metallopeptidase [Verrucomicrobiales bacterium]
MHWQTLPALWLDLEFYYPHLSWIAGLLLKSAVIFGAARLAAGLCRRRSARARNWLWRVTLMVMLALPCWDWAARHLDIFDTAPVVPLAVESRPAPHEIYQKLFIINSDLERENLLRADAIRKDSPPWHAFGYNASDCKEFQRAPWRWLENILPPLWLTVSVALLLAQVWRARAAKRWLRRHARAADIQLAANLPLTADVFLHGQLKSPLIVSGKVPRIYLPADAQHWSRDELRAVLLHEIAHWQRRDLLWQKIGNLARAVWWWNPFARRAIAHLAREAELAADDAVLLAQVPAPAYAQTLVYIAARASNLHTPAAGIPFIGKQPLQQRIQTLLSPNHWRGKIGRLALTLIIFSGIFALLTVSVKVMWQSQILSPEKFQQWQRELDERWIRAPAAFSPEQQRLATETLAALKARLTAQRYVHLKHEVRTRKQDNVSGEIIFASATPGRLELWLDEWRQNYRADIQPERDARGNTIFLTTDTVIISVGKSTYYQWHQGDFHVASSRELSFGFERLPMFRLADEATQRLQTFLDSVGKNHYSNIKYEIGLTEWRDRPLIYFRVASYDRKDRPPLTQETYLFDAQQNYALVGHQNFDRADWELLASGTDADGQPYPQKYRVTEIDRYKKTTTVSDYEVTLFEPLKKLPKNVLARPAKVIVSPPSRPSWWADLLSGCTATELLGYRRFPDCPPIPATATLQWPPTTVTVGNGM